MEKKNPPRSLLKLTISMLIFGTIGLFRRWIPVSSGFLAFARGILGASFLLLFLLWQKKRKTAEVSSQVLAALVISGAAIGINWILLFEAYRYTTVAVATLCYYMQPTIVILLSPLLFRERLTVRKIVCAALAILGMVLLSGILGGSSGPGNDHRGILFGLGAACFYSFVVILNKKLPPMDAYTKTVVQLFSAAAVMIPYLLITGDVSFSEMTGLSWILLFVVGIIHTGIAYVLYFGSMDVRAQTVAVFSYIDPVSALFFSWLFLHESLSLMGVIGAVLILGSAFISELSNG